MAATYTEGGVDPISMARRCAADTAVGGSERFPDERYWAWLDASRSMEGVRFWMPDDNDAGNASGTAEIKMNASDELVVELESDVSGTGTVVVAPSSDVPTVGQLVDAVFDLGHGWKVGLVGGHEPEEWFDEEMWAGSGDWRTHIEAPSVESLALYGPPRALALTGVAGASAPVSGFGEHRKDGALVRFYLYPSVAVRAFSELVAQSSGRAVKSRREGNVTRTFVGLDESLEAARRAASDGIYGSCA